MTRLAAALRDELGLIGTSRSVATPAIAGPARCCWTANRSAPVWSRWARSKGVASRPSRASPPLDGTRGLAEVLPRPWRRSVRHLHAGDADGGAGRAGRRSSADPCRGGRGCAGACVLCRCTGYSRIVDAVLAVACSQSPIAPAAGSAVGARLHRASTACRRSPGVIFLGPTRCRPTALWIRVVRSPQCAGPLHCGRSSPPCAVDLPPC